MLPEGYQLSESLSLPALTVRVRQPDSLSISVSPLLQLAGDTVTLKATVTGYEGAAYQWQWADVPALTLTETRMDAALADSERELNRIKEDSALTAEDTHALVWYDEPGATELIYRFTAQPDNMNRYWRLQLILPAEGAAQPDAGLLAWLMNWLLPRAQAEESTVVVSSAYLSLLKDYQRDGDWLYSLDDEGYATILGYADAAVTELVIPRSLGGHLVNAIGEQAFSRNGTLYIVRIHGNVQHIAADAFEGAPNVRISAWHGAEAQRFAQRQGIDFIKLSEFYFTDDVIDGSDLQPGAFTLIGKTQIRVAELDARRFQVGSVLYMPPQFVGGSGDAFVIRARQTTPDGVLFSLSQPEMNQVFTRIVENIQGLQPDYQNVTPLSEGVSIEIGNLASPYSRTSFVIVPKLPLKYELASEGAKFSFSGEVSLTLNADVDIGWHFLKPYIKKFDMSLVHRVDKQKFSVKFEESERARLAKLGLLGPGAGDLKLRKQKTVNLVNVPFAVGAGFTVNATLKAILKYGGEISMELDFIERTAGVRWTGSRLQPYNHENSQRMEVKGKAYAEALLQIAVHVAYISDWGKLAEISLAFGMGAKAEAVGVMSNLEESYIQFIAYAVFEGRLKAGLIGVAESFGVQGLYIDIELFRKELPLVRLFVDAQGNLIVGGLAYIVRFVTGCSQILPPQILASGERVAEPGSLQRPGYIFDGWYKESYYAKKWDFAKDVVKKDMILYAKWEPDGSASLPGEDDPDMSIITAPMHVGVEVLEWKKVDGGIEITHCTLNPDYGPYYLHIPEMIDGQPVISIGELACSSCEIVSVDLPGKLRTIEREAFIGNPLRWLAFPASLEEIDEAFDSPYITELHIPKKLAKGSQWGKEWGRGIGDLPNILSISYEQGSTKIGYLGSFHRVKSLTIPQGVEIIDSYAFAWYSSLRSVNLPESLKEIGSYAFTGCDELRDFSLPANLEMIDTRMLSTPYINKLVFPKTFKGSHNITYQPFIEMDNLRYVEFEHGTVEIPHSILADCISLEEVVLPNTLQVIGNGAFENCERLSSCILPDSVQIIGESAFCGCNNWSGFRIPASLVRLGGSPATTPFIRELVVPRAVAESSYEMRGWMALLPYLDSLPNLEHLVVEDGTTFLGEGVFECCHFLKSIELPNSLISVGVNSIAHCNTLTSIRLPEGVEIIKEEAFAGCGSLTEIRLPESLHTIGSGAFNGCPLTNVRLPSQLQKIGPSVFGGIKEPIMLFIPKTLRTIPGDRWTLFGYYDEAVHTLVFEEGTTIIDGELLSSIAVAHIPASVTEISGTILAGLREVHCVKGSYADQFFSEWDLSIIYYGENLRQVRFVSARDGALLAFSQANAGRPLTPPAVQLPEGQLLTGWFKDSACTQLWDFAVDRMPANALTLYAGSELQVPGLVYRSLPEGGIIITGYRGDSGALSLPDNIQGQPVRAIAAGAVGSNVYALYLPAGFQTMEPGALRHAENLASIQVASGNANYKTLSGCQYSADGKTLIAYPAGRSADAFSVPAGTEILASFAISNANHLRQLTMPASLISLPDRAVYQAGSLDKVTFSRFPDTLGDDPFTNCQINQGVYGPIGSHPLADYADKKGFGYNLYQLTCLVDGRCYYQSQQHAGAPLPDINPPRDPERTFLGWQQEGKTAYWDLKVNPMPAADLALHAQMKLPFTWTASGKGWKLMTYTGAALSVRVPETIEGKPVLAIDSGCFSGHSGLTLLGNKGSLTESFAAAHGLAFQAVRYTVRFDSQGGSYVPSRQRARGELLGASPTPVRDNHAIQGWFKEPYLLTLWDYAKDGMPGQDITLYAGWRKLDDSIADSGFTYRQESNEIYITGYQGRLMRPTLPATINGLPVVGIDDYAFYGNNALDALAIPDGVRSIGSYAFCESIIASLTIPASVTDIGEYALMNCVALNELTLSGGAAQLPAGMLQGCTGLFSLTIPEGVQSLGDSFAADCAFLEQVKLPNSLTDIGAHAFSGCARLSSITLPAGLNYINPDAFSGCDSLQAINVAAGNPAYKAVDGVLYDISGTTLLCYPPGREATSFTAPNSVTLIGDGAFRGSRLQSVVLPANLEYMGEGAFAGSQALNSVTWPSGGKLTDVPKDAFRNCTALTGVTLPASIESIGDSAFSGCYHLNQVNLGAKVNHIATNALPDNDWLTINGAAGSYAQQEAAARGIRFVDPKTMTPVTGISLSSASLTVPVAQSKQLKATLSPANTTETKVQWLSSDESVAVVDSAGLVTGRWVGKATISAYAANGAVATCEVTVNIPALKATAMSFAAAETTLRLGYAGQLGLQFTPAGAGVGQLAWVSSAPDKVRVDAFGMVTGVAVGSATITATAMDGSGLKASCTVTVGEPTLPGDANGDGTVDIIDLTSITDYLVKGIRCKSMLNADINEDGVVDDQDMMMIISLVVR